MDELIERLRERVSISPTTDCQQLPPILPRPPLQAGDVEAFTRETGIRLPRLLERIYLEVGDGGFGPDWGINPLHNGGESSVAGWDRIERREWPSGPPDGWPDPLLRIAEVGCNAYVGLDASSDDGQIYIVDPLQGTDDPTSWLIPQNLTLAQWLSDWLAKPTGSAAGE